MDQVAVFIIADGDELSSSGVNRVTQLFADPIFIVQALDINTTGKNAVAREAFRLQYALGEAKRRYPKQAVIIVKDTSVSGYPSSVIANRVTEINKNTTYDLCYLCRWLDKCQLYTDRKVLESNGNVIIVKTQYPQGIQAIMFSVAGRDLIMGNRPMRNNKLFELENKAANNVSSEITNAIFRGDIDATCVVPNLLDFDIANATSNEDYLKTQGCIGVSCDRQSASKRDLVVKDNSNNSLDLFWLGFILLVVVLIALVAAAYKLN